MQVGFSYICVVREIDEETLCFYPIVTTVAQLMSDLRDAMKAETVN